MRVLYTVAGEGYGHAIRSKPIIDFLRETHEVKVLAGEKAFIYFSKHFPVSRITTLRLFYLNNKVSNLLTVAWNIIKTPLLLYSAAKILHNFVAFRPQVVVTDFETISHYLALIAGIPVISVDNQNVLPNTKVDIPKNHKWNYLKTLATIKLLSPRPTRSLVPTFFYPEKKHSRIDLLYPVLREQILAQEPSDKGHVLVYQTSKTNKVLHDVLKASNHKFIVYGFDKNGIDKNIVYKAFNEREFFDDLASCKALITNGGFSLISEALHLNKPILSNAIGGTFEQALNAHYLDMLGYGMFAEELTAVKFKDFLDNLPKYRQSLENYKKQDNSVFFTRLGEIINVVAKK